MKWGLCRSFRTIPPGAVASLDYLEESVQRFLVPERSQEEFAANLHAARAIPLPIETANGFFPGDLKLVETPTQQVDRPRLERYVRMALRRAEQAGIRLIVFGSGSARACPPGDDQHAALRQLAEYLATWSRWACEHGVTIVLEPLRTEETNLLNTVAQSGEFVARIAPSGAKLLVDTYHMSCNHEDPATILPWGRLLAHVHVAEGEGRSAPGTHGQDFRPTFSMLRQAGYDQRISIECQWDDLAAQLPPAIALLKAQWAASVQERGGAV